MVKTAYLIDKPRSVGTLKRFVDQRLFPAAIDAAASVEGALENLTTGVRTRPLPLLLAAMGFGMLASVMVRAATRRGD